MFNARYVGTIAGCDYFGGAGLQPGPGAFVLLPATELLEASMEARAFPAPEGD